MKFEYIDKNGNKSETEDLNEVPANFEKIDNIYFEKREVEVVKTKKETKEVVKEVAEEVTITTPATEDVNLDDDYLAFLKEKKIRGAHLLKGDKLKEKAIAEGFII